MSNKISFILGSCGRIGIRHAGHIPDYGALATICDTDKYNAKVGGLAKAYQTTAYHNLPNLFL